MARNLRSRRGRNDQTDAARAAAEAEARRVAAEQEAERIAAEQEAERIAAENVARNQNGANLGLQAVLTMLAQVLERLPAVNPLGVGNPNGNENGNERIVENAVVDEEIPVRIPPYLTVLDHMQKLGTKFFRGGGTKPVEADEWRSRLERNFESIRCPEQYKKDIAVHYLEEDAHIWWKGASGRLPNPDCSWETFSAMFMTKYFPPEAYDRLEAAFLDLHQGDKTVREYEAEFNQLKRYAGRELEDEYVQVRRFMRGLRVEIRNGCLVRNFASVGELVEKAAMLEDGIAEERKLKGGTAKANARPHDQSGSGGQNKKNLSKPDANKFSAGRRSACAKCGKMHAGECRAGTFACYRCGEMGHTIRDCPEKGDVGDVRVCYYCKESGHIRQYCPKLVGQDTGNGKRPSDGPQPQAKRQAIEPRLYNMVEHGENSGENARPITGKSCQLT